MTRDTRPTPAFADSERVWFRVAVIRLFLLGASSVAGPAD
jgi:hypothetical protein